MTLVFVIIQPCLSLIFHDSDAGNLQGTFDAHVFLSTVLPDIVFVP